MCVRRAPSWAVTLENPRGLERPRQRPQPTLGFEGPASGRGEIPLNITPSTRLGEDKLDTPLATFASVLLQDAQTSRPRPRGCAEPRAAGWLGVVGTHQRARRGWRTAGAGTQGGGALRVWRPCRTASTSGRPMLTGSSCPPSPRSPGCVRLGHGCGVPPGVWTLQASPALRGSGAASWGPCYSLPPDQHLGFV